MLKGDGMKIYQIHKSGGCYEDHYDYIAFSYLDYIKASAKKVELDEQELVERRCDRCPLVLCNDDYCDGNCKNCNEDKKIKNAKDYCGKCLIEKVKYEGCENEYYLACKNNSNHSDDSYFRIEEVEVIE
jgi:hypothetical protein